MIQKVFGVYDSKAEAYLQPWFAITAGAAIRAFSDAVNEGKSPLCKHPEDYILYELADFDDATGDFVRDGNVKMLGVGSSYIEAVVANGVPVGGK